MFTDTEIGLMLKHRRDLAAYAGEAQAIVDSRDNEIARLRRQLAAAQRRTGDLVLSRGREHNELIAHRIAARN